MFEPRLEEFLPCCAAPLRGHLAKGDAKTGRVETSSEMMLIVVWQKVDQRSDSGHGTEREREGGCRTL